MRILLTNDDGISAPGIVALHDAIQDLGEVVVVAPKTVQSATSHGITYHQPLMVSQVRVTRTMQGAAVDGRPADCVKLALTNLWPERFGEGQRPDLVISGMNAGANCGINVIYSGTVAAAIEAAFLGVPSIAVSQLLAGGDPDFDAGARHARRAIGAILDAGPMEPHECLSVNIPRTERGDPDAHAEREIRVCPMNVHGLVDRYERRESPGGEAYYWASGHGLDFRSTDSGTDVHELKNGRITLTPLHFDLTSHAGLDRWRQRLGE
ncbi:MAG: 5'/3'-nucleotidase SurE [Phycisphaerales bacterium JB059]